MKKKLKRRIKDRGEKMYDDFFLNYVDMMNLGKKFTAGEVIAYSIEHIKAKLDMIKFALVDCYKNPPNFVLESRIPPLSCIDMYMRSVRRYLVIMENMFEDRADEIRKIRGEKTR